MDFVKKHFFILSSECSQNLSKIGRLSSEWQPLGGNSKYRKSRSRFFAKSWNIDFSKICLNLHDLPSHTVIIVLELGIFVDHRNVWKIFLFHIFQPIWSFLVWIFDVSVTRFIRGILNFTLIDFHVEIAI